VAELLGARSSGKAALALQAAARITKVGQLVAWIDSRRELYPPAVAALGVDLRRLLIVRPPAGMITAARAAEIVAQSRAFPFIVIDLAEGRLEGNAGARLRQVAHDANAALVLLAMPHAVSSIAQVRIEVSPRQAILVRGGAAPAGARARVPWIPPRDLSPFRPPERRVALLQAAPAGTVLPRPRQGGPASPPESDERRRATGGAASRSAVLR
jgi:hypothetical protein